MISITRTVGFLLILLGVVGYFATGAASITALIPAMIGAVFLVIALVGRSTEARKHAMHAALVVALVSLVGVVPRVLGAVRAGDLQRPAVMAQVAMIVILVVYILLGIKSFIDARRARRG